MDQDIWFKRIPFLFFVFVFFFSLPIVRGCNKAKDEMAVAVRKVQQEQREKEIEASRWKVKMHRAEMTNRKPLAAHHDKAWHDRAESDRAAYRKKQLAEINKQSALTEDQQAMVQDMIEDEADWNE